jgi:hypothetical protein
VNAKSARGRLTVGVLALVLLSLSPITGCSFVRVVAPGAAGAPLSAPATSPSVTSSSIGPRAKSSTRLFCQWNQPEWSEDIEGWKLEGRGVASPRGAWSPIGSVTVAQAVRDEFSESVWFGLFEIGPAIGRHEIRLRTFDRAGNESRPSNVVQVSFGAGTDKRRGVCPAVLFLILD